MSKPSVREMIRKAREAGHDTLGIASDPETLGALRRARRKRLKELCEQYDGSERKFIEIVAGFVDLTRGKEADLKSGLSASWETLKHWAEGSSCPATHSVRQIFVNEIKNLLNEG